MTNLSKDKASAGDQIPAKCAVIEVHVGELRQLFDAIDPSPFLNHIAVEPFKSAEAKLAVRSRSAEARRNPNKHLRQEQLKSKFWYMRRRVQVFTQRRAHKIVQRSLALR